MYPFSNYKKILCALCVLCGSSIAHAQTAALFSPAKQLLAGAAAPAATISIGELATTISFSETDVSADRISEFQRRRAGLNSVGVPAWNDIQKSAPAMSAAIPEPQQITIESSVDVTAQAARDHAPRPCPPAAPSYTTDTPTLIADTQDRVSLYRDAGLKFVPRDCPAPYSALWFMRRKIAADAEIKSPAAIRKERIQYLRYLAAAEENERYLAASNLD